MTKCQHKNIDRGIKFPTMKYFSFCKDCKKQWLDNGKRWETGLQVQFRQLDSTLTAEYWAGLATRVSSTTRA